ncbi:hypothetical protein PBN151_0092 [Paenibacillus sp. NAIST15-1]|nr:hypothetical protein PBN151_0092 [Paenibacillus sp. NAIST15-1]
MQQYIILYRRTHCIHGQEWMEQINEFDRSEAWVPDAKKRDRHMSLFRTTNPLDDAKPRFPDERYFHKGSPVPASVA